MLPDGELTRAGGLTAWLAGPTRRYAHGALGDAIEAEGFMAEVSGRILSYTLPDTAVFEDRRVRLWDIDGDGTPEAVVIKAYLDKGAALALYRIGRDTIEPLAESPAIGIPNRWLNPVGAADFLGDGSTTVAAVITPHLAGSLRLYRLVGDALTEVARVDGFTNHINGSRDLDLAQVVPTRRGPVIAIPTLDRRAMATISFAGGRPALLSKQPASGRIDRLERRGRDVWFRLETGAWEKLTPPA
jgi:hypothetical protein